MRSKHDTTNKPQARHKHPDAYEHDLNPRRMQGQNIGAQSTALDPLTRYASDIKELTVQLRDFKLDELREIPVVPAGERLQQGKTYVDLRSPERKPFTATGAMVAGADQLFIAKSEVPFEYWNRLVPPEKDHHARR
jgi:hypothetical protein